MSYIIRTRCPNGCKYKSGYTCVASKCPYQTGDVRYDIRMNAGDKPTKINAEVKQDVKDFAERLKEKYGKSCSEYYPLLLELTSEQLDETLKEFIND